MLSFFNRTSKSASNSQVTNVIREKQTVKAVWYDVLDGFVFVWAFSSKGHTIFGRGSTGPEAVKAFWSNWSAFKPNTDIVVTSPNVEHGFYLPFKGGAEKLVMEHGEWILGDLDRKGTNLMDLAPKGEVDMSSGTEPCPFG